MRDGKTFAGWMAAGILLLAALAATGTAARYAKRMAELDSALLRAQAETDTLRLRQEKALWRPSGPEAVVPTEDSEANGAGDRSEIARLENRVRELEAALSERERQRTARGTRTQEDGVEREPAPRRQRFDLESLRESDPERYQRIVERREQMRERTQQAFSRKADFLANRDLSDLDETEQAEHKRTQELLQAMWELAEHNQQETTRQERMQLWREMGQHARELGPLLHKARDREFVALGKSLGYADDDAAAFAGYLNEVIETTSLTGGLMPRGFGRGRRTGPDASPAPPQEAPGLRAP